MQVFYINEKLRKNNHPPKLGPSVSTRRVCIGTTVHCTGHVSLDECAVDGRLAGQSVLSASLEANKTARRSPASLRTASSSAVIVEEGAEVVDLPKSLVGIVNQIQFELPILQPDVVKGQCQHAEPQ